MLKQNHLLQYDCKLIADTPVFVGSGKVLNKKEFSFDPMSRKVSIIDIQKLMQAIIDKDIVDDYEKMVLTNSYNGDMHGFLKSFFTNAEIENFTLYKCDASDSFDEEHSKSEINQFARMADGRAYIPGSSIKGALRTCILALKIMEYPERAREIFRQGTSENYRWTTDKRSKISGKIEREYINSLKVNEKKRTDEVNSLMRAISISDSEPIEFSSMILCKKIDVSTNGVSRSLPLVRECIRPGTSVSFTITIDNSFADISSDYIIKAISSFSHLYQSDYVPQFDLQRPAVSWDYRDKLLLGGGSGYYSKTVVYPMFEHDEALDYVVKIMTDNFKKHRHESDAELGVSPRMLKYTRFGNQLVPMGVCKLVME